MVTHLILEGDGALKDTAPEGVIQPEGNEVWIARLPGGMASGGSSVTVAARVQGSKKMMVIQVSMEKFLLAADAFRIREEQDKHKN